MSDKRWEIDQIDESNCYTVYVTNGVQRYFVGQSSILQGTDDLLECLHKTAQELCDEWNVELDSKLLKNHKFSISGVSVIREYPRSIVIAPNNHISNSNKNCVEINSEDSSAIARHFYNRSGDKEAFIKSIKGKA